MIRRAGLYIGWVGRQNLGDEAMWWACRNQFRQIYWRLFDPSYGRSFAELLNGVVRRRKGVRSLALHAAHRLLAGITGLTGILGGGTLINRDRSYLSSYDLLRQRLGRPIPIFGTGVANPEFWSGHDDWSDHRWEWAKRLNELPVVGVRGPLSRALLEEAGTRGVEVVGDCALVLSKFYPYQNRGASDSKRLRIGINCGGSRGNIWGKEDELLASLAALGRDLSRLGHEVLFFAIWPEDLKYCVEAARQSGLPLASVSEGLFSHKPFFKYVRSLDLIVAMKLHAGVLAAAAGVPFLMLEYRPKCLDFAQSLNWGRFTIRTNRATTAKLLDLTLDLAEQLPQMSHALRQRVSELTVVFDGYCKKLLPLMFA